MNKIRNREGFSFIEIIIFVAIAAVLMLVVNSLKNNVSSIGGFVDQKLLSKQDVEQALQIMVTEIRSAGPSSLGAYPVESATTSSFAFFSDINKDGIFEKVRYFLATNAGTSTATSTIKKGVIIPTGNPLTYVTSTEIISKVINNVVVSTSSNLFDYFDSSATSTAKMMTLPVNVQSIRIVRFNIYADLKPGSAPKPSFFSDVANIRNLRSN
ncbi:MAG: type II secretion system protein [Candidatus Paceibacterota bacterium]|jgi:Tfp pilus assembly protein PilW